MKKSASKKGKKKVFRPKAMVSSLKSRGRTQTRALPTAFAYSRSVPFVRPLKLSHTEYLTTYTASQAVGTGTVLLDLPIGSKRVSGVDSTVTMPWFNQLSTLYKEFVIDNLTVRLNFQNGTSMSGAICIWYEPDVMFNTSGLTASAILQRANTTPGALVTSVFGSKVWKVTNVLPGRRYVTASGVGGDSDRLETAGKILIAAASNLPTGCTFSVDIDWAAKFYEPTIGQSAGGSSDEKVASRVFVTPPATTVPTSSVGSVFAHLTKAAENVAPGFIRMAEQELARGARDVVNDVLGASFSRPALNNSFNTKIYIPKGNWIFDATVKFNRYNTTGAENRVFTTGYATSYNTEVYNKQPYVDFTNGSGITTTGTNSYEGIVPQYDQWDATDLVRYFTFGSDMVSSSNCVYKARSTVQVTSDGSNNAWIDPGLYTVDEAARDQVIEDLIGAGGTNILIKDLVIDLTLRETMMQSSSSGQEVMYDERACVLAPANSVFPVIVNEEKSYVCVDQPSPGARKMSLKPNEKVVAPSARSSSQPPSVRVKTS